MMDLFMDIEKHLMEDSKPSIYLESLLREKKLESYPLDMLRDMVHTPQEPKHHPEGNVWNHVMMVVDNGAIYRGLSKDKEVFMWATLLHDIGKYSTTRTRKGRITSYDHDKVGEEMAVKFLRYFNEKEEKIHRISKLVRYHMHSLFVINKLPFGNVKGMVAETNLNEVGLLSLCDRLGRGGITEEKRQEVLENINKFLEIVHKETSEQYNKLTLLP